jgi:hypothetical protein
MRQGGHNRCEKTSERDADQSAAGPHLTHSRHPPVLLLLLLLLLQLRTFMI